MRQLNFTQAASEGVGVLPTAKGRPLAASDALRSMLDIENVVIAIEYLDEFLLELNNPQQVRESFRSREPR